MLGLVREVNVDTEASELDELAQRRAAAGEAAACRMLVEVYQVRVFALVSRMLASRDGATVEDVAQDTFLDVFRSLPHFQIGGSARLSTWILTIAARRAIDELRKQRPEGVPELERFADDGATHGGGEAAARRRQLVAALEAAIADLSPELRAAFLLREYHELDYAAIATALGIELGTVKSRLGRARAALRARLAEVHDAGR
jgi:RNA polymerase sigma-70 factor (ECF subfamily)